jgi:hypothetical protein
LFLSSTGVYRVQQIVESRLGTAATAVSQDIPGVMGRVNWSAAAGAQGAVLGDYYYLALPMDRSATNNALLAYNLVTEAWEGMHTYGIRIDKLIAATVDGRRRLLAVDFESGGAHLLYEGGHEDCFAPEGVDDPTAPAAIAAEVVSRGYRAESTGRKRFRFAQVDVVSRGPSWGAELLTDGNAEAVALAPATVARSRTRNLDGSAWTSTNGNDDHGDPGREDYAVVCPFRCGSGIVLSREQSFTERFAAMGRGRVARVRLRSTRGLLGIQALRVEGTEIDRGMAVQT